MRKVLTLLMMLVAAPAGAEWEMSGLGEGGVYFIDKATIKRHGNLVRAWALHDYRTVGEFGERSMRTLEEFDCELERFRLLAFSMHSDLRASGKVLASQTIEETTWEYIAPGTVGAASLRMVCDRQ